MSRNDRMIRVRTSTEAVPTPLEMDCLEIPYFDPGDFDAVQKAFQLAPPLPLRQAWRAREQNEFKPGFVRMGWNDSALLVFAELDDLDISTRATGQNQRLWDLGDVFEILLRPAGQSSYVELQIAPNNCRLQLLFSDAAALKKAREADDFNPHLIWNDTLYSITWVKPADERWFVFVKVPQNLVCEKQEPLQGQRWQFSFGRMDYTSSRRKPIASSTSPHKRLDFHRHEEWPIIRFT